MGSVSQEMEEIKAVLLAAPSPAMLSGRSFAYTSLLHLQQRSANNPTSLDALSRQSTVLLSPILSDISLHDEETAAQALKCLGFIIYHPDLVSSIPEGIACLVVESLATLVMTTRMKAICNLGVWCISVQQFDAAILDIHFNSLLLAVVHALDNPFGSLSTTFEATQAVVKLLTQHCEKMREMSGIWAPPVYRRLISNNKKERDMSQRCLLRIKSVAFPLLSISKVIATDLKQKLLPAMMDMLQDHGQKVYTIQAWGWYIRLLGYDALKNRNLVNEMLKVPEQAFSDPDPQIQIASLVAWEGLIDALISHQILVKLNTVQVDVMQQHGPVTSIASIRNHRNQLDVLLRRTKLLMLPLIGIMSRKSDTCVHLSCINTWHYLLHKLSFSADLSAASPSSVLVAILEPVLEKVFGKVLDSRSIWIWNFCLDLLDEFVLSKVTDGEKVMNDKESAYLTKITSECPMTSIGSWRNYPIKWLPWELTEMNLFLKMIGKLVSQGLLMTMTTDDRILAFNGALRIFRSVLKAIQVEFKKSPSHCSSTLSCINSILMFAKGTCEDLTSKAIDVQRSESLSTALHFVEIMMEELEPSILLSPLYKVGLDLKYICNLQPAENIRSPKFPGICSITYMEKVLPVVYLNILYLSVVVQSFLNMSDTETNLDAVHCSKVLFSCNSVVNLHAVTSFLYMHRKEFLHEGLCWLKMWRVIAEIVKEHIDSFNGLAFSKAEYDDASHDLMHWFLCYPLVMCFHSEKILAPEKIGCFLDMCLVSSEVEHGFGLVIEVWKSLLDSLNHASKFQNSLINNFIEGLCNFLVGVLDKNISMFQESVVSCLKNKCQNIAILSVLGEIVCYLLKQLHVMDAAALVSLVNKQEGSICKEDSHMKTSLEFVSRFLSLSHIVVKTSPQAEHMVIARVFAELTRLVGCLCWKQDILVLMEVISDPLMHWLSSCAPRCSQVQEGSILHQLQLFWSQNLNCLQRSQPPIVFDSSFLRIHAPLLQTALDHPHIPISNSTVMFWKATYGKEINIHYPRCLLPFLDKLSGNGIINLLKEIPTTLEGDCSTSREASQERISKGVDLKEDTENDLLFVDIVPIDLRKKRLKLNKHVVGRDEENHTLAPGLIFDFHQGCGHLQNEEKLRNPDCILQMLRKGR